MTESWMYGERVEIDDRPVCNCCQRKVERVRGSMWHGSSLICTECFCQWYDPDSAAVDSTDPASIGNHVRKKHGLPPIDAVEKAA